MKVLPKVARGDVERTFHAIGSFASVLHLKHLKREPYP